MTQEPADRLPEQPTYCGGSLRKHNWIRFLRGPDQELLDNLYQPALAEAIRYDRCCSYFSSSVLAAAARGFAGLIERLTALGDRAPRPAVRLVVNEELLAEDVRAMTETGDLSALEELLLRRLKAPKELLEKQRLAMLSWMVKHGLLEVRVGVMRQGEGIVHAKFGIATDEAGDAVVFSGSGNESARGLRANYERLEISNSWEDPERYQEYAGEFEALWQDTHADVHTVPLPEAIRLKLIKFAPPEAPLLEPSTALQRQKAAMIWRFIFEAPYMPNGEAACDATTMVDLWPHQRRVVEETAAAWPDGRLLCDEVGMGKTIEAILILRRLMAGRGVQRAILLVPKGIVKQWQGELREKGGMIIPRLEGTSTIVWPDERSERMEGLQAALKNDVLLMSRETARTENNLGILLEAEPWDLVLLDEAHAARRREQQEGEFNSGTLLLDLLRQLQLKRRARGFLLLSATPMQTHPWEPWDLLGILGEGGAWLAEFPAVRLYYTAITGLANAHCDVPLARHAADLIAADPNFPPAPEDRLKTDDPESVADHLAFATPRRRPQLAEWLRKGSPLARRMHRNTRDTLRQYFAMGLLPTSPPRRIVHDVRFDFPDPAEREVYEHVGRYIEKRFEELEKEKPGKGFVMTVYRRRASSSPLALERSLERRRAGLLRVVKSQAYDFDLQPTDVPEDLDPDELPESEQTGKISAALPQDPKTAKAEMDEVNRLLGELTSLSGRDSKRDEFFRQLKTITEDGRSVLVFTGYTDTLEYLRDALVTHYGETLGCYSGDGGQTLVDGEWKMATRDAITESLREGRLKVLVCTDAASEGLNLQAAGALINYDLPWNPSKIEQRIGRIDRIGQACAEVRIVNLFLNHSVDDQVYRVLRERCGLFEHFVGAMQPVLARARKMLTGQDPVDPSGLRRTAAEVESDPLGKETYLQSAAEAEAGAASPLQRQHIEDSIPDLTGEFGPRGVTRDNGDIFELSMPGSSKWRYTARLERLEKDKTLVPLSPLCPELRALLNVLEKPGERLPLVMSTFQSGPFRVSAARWISGADEQPITSFEALRDLVRQWDGKPPNIDAWQRASADARAEAEKEVRRMEGQANERVKAGLSRQLEAARQRLLWELGRYLVALGFGTADLNRTLYQQMSRDISSAERLKRCLERLGGGYPSWSPRVIEELNDFATDLSENERKARLLGSQLNAALDDPRWAALDG